MHLMAQPWVKTTMRTPGPSTAGQRWAKGGVLQGCGCMTRHAVGKYRSAIHTCAEALGAVHAAPGLCDWHSRWMLDGQYVHNGSLPRSVNAQASLRAAQDVDYMHSRSCYEPRDA